MHSGYLYPVPTLELRMGGSGGGVSLGEPWKSPNTRDHHPQIKAWATPQAHDVAQGDADRVGRFGTDAGGRNLTDEVSLWSTPRFEDSQCAGSRVGRGVNDTLYSQTRAWGTPRANEYKGTGPKGTVSQLHRLGKGYLDAQVEEVSDAGKNAESLNPNWEEILMGWEIGWTDPTKPCGIFPGFPLGQGHEQFDYEPPRTLPRKQMTGRTARIKMVGNGIVPQCAFAAYVRLLSELLGSPEVSA
jgi:hypothetical protein